MNLSLRLLKSIGLLDPDLREKMISNDVLLYTETGASSIITRERERIPLETDGNRCKTPLPSISGAWGILWKKKRKGCRSLRRQGHHKKTVHRVH